MRAIIIFGVFINIKGSWKSKNAGVCGSLNQIYLHKIYSVVQFSRSVMSNSLRPHELQHARPPCPSPTPRVHSNPPQSCLTLCDPMDCVACQAPLSMGFSRQEYESRLPFPPPGGPPNPGIEPVSLTSPAWVGRFFTTSATWEVLGVSIAALQTGSSVPSF